MKRRSLPPKQKSPGDAPISRYRQKQIEKARERAQARKWKEFSL